MTWKTGELDNDEQAGLELRVLNSLLAWREWANSCSRAYRSEKQNLTIPEATISPPFPPATVALHLGEVQSILAGVFLHWWIAIVSKEDS